MEKILVNLLKIGLFITMNNKTERHIIANTIFLILWGIIMIFASSGCAYFSRTKKSSSSEKFHYTIPKPAQEIPSSVVSEHEPPEPVRKNNESLLTSANSSEYSSSQYSGWGYRIQVFSSLQQDESEELARKVREKIDAKVYVEFDPPYYKVRVGNCKDSGEAEELIRKLKNLGYSDAWIVRARIINDD
ncbi:SPOR domain-containing protein [bacterium]|nr:SPOR domain-containing protein [bacterium]